MNQVPHILVVDDDERLRILLSRYIDDNNMRATMAADTDQARRLMAVFLFDMLVIDIMMPGESGIDFAGYIRKMNPIPILMLTAIGETENRITSFEIGVDDYLTKPFEPRELLLRIQAILRRGKTTMRIVRFGQNVFDMEKELLEQDGKLIKLTEGELIVLKRLIKAEEAPVSREELDHRNAESTTRGIDVHIARLRRKIETDPKMPLYLRTIRGYGYALKLN